VSFEKNIIALYGQQGEQWLAALPSIINDLARLWGLSDLKPYENLSYHYVLHGLKGEQPIVLKLHPQSDGLHNEIRALQAFAESGMVKLIDSADGALLCERLLPGEPLRSLFPDRDKLATDIFVAVMRNIHNNQAVFDRTAFLSLADWFSVFDQDYDIPDHYLVKARIVRDDLLATTEPAILLHGDLHHDNILSHGDDWIAIDPKGVIGDPLFDATAFIHNPHDQFFKYDDIELVINRRLDWLVQAGVGRRERIIQWCYVQTILSWIWTIQDSLDTKSCERLVGAFYAVLS
jgi:streptomycin 6-kinase